MIQRVHFVIDGFNLYHSIRAAEAQASLGLRWLDLTGLCQTILTSFLGPGHTCEGIDYFTALANHREAARPGITARHMDYINAVRTTGVNAFLGKFKSKPDQCLKCGDRFMRHEEKETDVAVASRLIELAMTGTCDVAVLISGDSDMVPAIRTIRRLKPEVRVIAAFPFDRRSKDLADVAHASLKLSINQYRGHQLASEIAGPGGRVIHKPARW